MCEELATECEGLGYEELDECQQIGARGLRDARHEDQCYVLYDGCIDECRFISRWGPKRGDSGATRDAAAPAADAGTPDSGT